MSYNGIISQIYKRAARNNCIFKCVPNADHPSVYIRYTKFISPYTNIIDLSAPVSHRYNCSCTNCFVAHMNKFITSTLRPLIKLYPIGVRKERLTKWHSLIDYIMTFYERDTFECAQEADEKPYINDDYDDDGIQTDKESDQYDDAADESYFWDIYYP